ncbi:unnamed protein product [Miscanthus lutarioriparius]|uniref:BZIP domain-containing protein n=1 Tax=Miscanthus lutarioriparius TaxID=422564 RepID=A0A811Q934_9POAL|nr:unnamed protein product [Miscanthus lutarioriparius]
MSEDSDGQRQCRRGVTVDVELDAAMALADMAGVGPAGEQQLPPVRHAPPPPPPPTTQEDEEELASTRLSLELGKVGIQASPCSSSSSAGGGGHPPHHAHHHQAYQQQPVPATAAGSGTRPPHALTEAEKEAKRLRRVLANRESARQTILRRQAIRDELARKVADLSSQNENMKKEKDMVMQEYLSLNEANKQLKEQVATRTAKKAPAAVTAAMPAQQQQAESLAAASTASPPATPPRPGFLYTAEAPAPVVPVPYVWSSWPPGAAGYEHHHHGNKPGPPALCLQPCAWYYPVVAADPRGSPSSAAPAYAQQQQPQPAGAFQDPRGAVAAAEPVGSPAGGGGATAEEDTDDDPCSLTLGLDVVDKRSAPVSIFPAGPGGGGGGAGAQSDRDKAATAAEARKRRKELTKLKHMHASASPGGEQC